MGKGKKVVVTGASGHIGYNVAQQLNDKGYEVLLFIRRENINIFKLKQKGIEVHVCDLFKPETYSEQLKNVEVVFHLAAENTTSKSNSDRTILNTVGLTQIFLNTCVEQNIPQIIYTSSVVVLGRSNSKSKLLKEGDRASFIESPYVDGKLKAEDYVQELIDKSGADIRRVYPAWVIGPGDARMTPPHKIITDYVEKGQFFYFPGGISLCSVESIAEGHINASEKGEKQGQYVLGGDNVTFQEFYNLMAEETGYSKPKFKIPKWVIVAGARFTKPIFKMFGMQPMLEPSYAKSVIGSYSWYDSSKAIKEIEYNKVAAQEIIKNAVVDARKRISATTHLGLRRTPELKEPNNEGALLITGVPGWLGNRIVDTMINGNKQGKYQSNRKVKLLVQPSFKGYLDLPSNFEVVYGDLMNKDSLKEALEGVETVYHIAGAIYPKRVSTLYDVNYRGTKNLVDACIDLGIKRILYASTDSVCGKGTKAKRIFDEHNPPTPYKNYGKSKYLAEKYIIDKTNHGQIEGTSLRMFWFFGPFAPPRQLNFIRMMEWPKQLIFGNGKNFRSISHVDNSVQAFFKAENSPKTYGKAYWICGNESDMTTNHMYKTIVESLGQKFNPLYIPKWMCKMFGMADTMLGWVDLLHPSIHAAGKFYFDIAGDISAAKRDFGYEPTVSFEEAVEELKELV